MPLHIWDTRSGFLLKEITNPFFFFSCCPCYWRIILAKVGIQVSLKWILPECPHIKLESGFQDLEVEEILPLSHFCLEVFQLTCWKQTLGKELAFSIWYNISSGRMISVMPSWLMTALHLYTDSTSLRVVINLQCHPAHQSKPCRFSLGKCWPSCEFALLPSISRTE